jgi:hypothetical protein
MIFFCFKILYDQESYIETGLELWYAKKNCLLSVEILEI